MVTMTTDAASAEDDGVIYLVFVGDVLDYTSFLGTVTCLRGRQEKNRERHA